MSDPLNILDAALAGPPPGALVIAFSGGLDSTVLLHLAARSARCRAQGLRAIHVNHRLHPHSDRWARHCMDACAAVDVPLQVVEVAVTPDGDGPESAARRARWQAFDESTAGGETIALAHHRDDQAETVLLRLLRGAGPAGLSAMRVLSMRDDGRRVWRPFLDIGRAQLEVAARMLDLAWLDDPANANPAFDRNHLRHVVLPALRSRWPQADAILAQVAERQSQAHALEREHAHGLLAQAATADPRVLDIDPLRRATRPARWAALRTWLAGQGARDVGAGRLERIDAEVIDANTDADPRIDLGRCIVRRHRQHLHALRAGDDDVVDYRLDWDGRAPLVLPGGIGTLRIEPPPREGLPLQVGNRGGGERLRVGPAGHRHTLKHLLQDAGIPSWQRARWPVVWLDGEVVAFADVLASGDWAARLASLDAHLHFDPH